MSSNTLHGVDAPDASPARRVPHPKALILAMAVVEAMLGRRPLHHLRPRLSEDAFVHLAMLVRTGRFKRSRISSWTCQMPTARAAEITITVTAAPRWLVCVLRLDQAKEWTCSEFTVLGA